MMRQDQIDYEKLLGTPYDRFLEMFQKLPVGRWHRFTGYCQRKKNGGVLFAGMTAVKQPLNKRRVIKRKGSKR